MRRAPQFAGVAVRTASHCPLSNKSEPISASGAETSPVIPMVVTPSSRPNARIKACATAHTSAPRMTISRAG